MTAAAGAAGQAARRAQTLPCPHLSLDLERPQREGVLADEAVDVAGPELDLHVVADLIEGRRARVVVAGRGGGADGGSGPGGAAVGGRATGEGPPRMLLARLRHAEAGRDPEVAAASVENNVQVLRRRADAHLADVLGLRTGVPSAAPSAALSRGRAGATHVFDVVQSHGDEVLRVLAPAGVRGELEEGVATAPQRPARPQVVVGLLDAALVRVPLAARNLARVHGDAQLRDTGGGAWR